MAEQISPETVVSYLEDDGRGKFLIDSTRIQSMGFDHGYKSMFSSAIDWFGLRDIMDPLTNASKRASEDGQDFVASLIEGQDLSALDGQVAYLFDRDVDGKRYLVRCDALAEGVDVEASHREYLYDFSDSLREEGYEWQRIVQIINTYPALMTGHVQLTRDLKKEIIAKLDNIKEFFEFLKSCGFQPYQIQQAVEKEQFSEFSSGRQKLTPETQERIKKMLLLRQGEKARMVQELDQSSKAGDLLAQRDFINRLATQMPLEALVNLRKQTYLDYYDSDRVDLSQFEAFRKEHKDLDLSDARWEFFKAQTRQINRGLLSTCFGDAISMDGVFVGDEEKGRMMEEMAQEFFAADWHYFSSGSLRINQEHIELLRKEINRKEFHSFSLQLANYGKVSTVRTILEGMDYVNPCLTGDKRLNEAVQMELRSANYKQFFQAFMPDQKFFDRIDQNYIQPRVRKGQSLSDEFKQQCIDTYKKMVQFDQFLERLRREGLDDEALEMISKLPEWRIYLDGAVELTPLAEFQFRSQVNMAHAFKVEYLDHPDFQKVRPCLETSYLHLVHGAEIQPFEKKELEFLKMYSQWMVENESFIESALDLTSSAGGISSFENYEMLILKNIMKQNLQFEVFKNLLEKRGAHTQHLRRAAIEIKALEKVVDENLSSNPFSPGSMEYSLIEELKLKAKDLDQDFLEVARKHLEKVKAFRQVGVQRMQQLCQELDSKIHDDGNFLRERTFQLKMLALSRDARASRSINKRPIHETFESICFNDTRERVLQEILDLLGDENNVFVILSEIYRLQGLPEDDPQRDAIASLQMRNEKLAEIYKSCSDLGELSYLKSQGERPVLLSRKEILRILLEQLGDFGSFLELKKEQRIVQCGLVRLPGARDFGFREENLPELNARINEINEIYKAYTDGGLQYLNDNGSFNEAMQKFFENRNALVLGIANIERDLKNQYSECIRFEGTIEELFEQTLYDGRPDWNRDVRGRLRDEIQHLQNVKQEIKVEFEEDMEDLQKELKLMQERNALSLSAREWCLQRKTEKEALVGLRQALQEFTANNHALAFIQEHGHRAYLERVKEIKAEIKRIEDLPEAPDLEDRDGHLVTYFSGEEKDPETRTQSPFYVMPNGDLVSKNAKADFVIFQSFQGYPSIHAARSLNLPLQGLNGKEPGEIVRVKRMPNGGIQPSETRDGDLIFREPAQEVFECHADNELGRRVHLQSQMQGTVFSKLTAYQRKEARDDKHAGITAQVDSQQSTWLMKQVFQKILLGRLDEITPQDLEGIRAYLLAIRSSDIHDQIKQNPAFKAFFKLFTQVDSQLQKVIYQKEATSKTRDCVETYVWRKDFARARRMAEIFTTVQTWKHATELLSTDLDQPNQGDFINVKRSADALALRLQEVSNRMKPELKRHAEDLTWTKAVRQEHWKAPEGMDIDSLISSTLKEAISPLMPRLGKATTYLSLPSKSSKLQNEMREALPSSYWGDNGTGAYPKTFQNIPRLELTLRNIMEGSPLEPSFWDAMDALELMKIQVRKGDAAREDLASKLRLRSYVRSLGKIYLDGEIYINSKY